MKKDKLKESFMVNELSAKKSNGINGGATDLSREMIDTNDAHTAGDVGDCDSDRRSEGKIVDEITRHGGGKFTVVVNGG